MILRQQNFLGQQRVDVPHLRALESSLCADFDVLAGTILAGQYPLVVSGFTIPMTTAIGSQASSLQVVVNGGVLMNYNASEAGTIYSVPAGRAVETLSTTNTRVIGSFLANQVNFVGIDLVRSADSTTSDLVQFLNGSSLTEVSQTVPLARTLDYRIVITTSDFSVMPGVVPIAKVTTDANNNVTAVTDARRLFYRLGSGGSVPNIGYSYAWPGGRKENTTGDVFAGADKSITNSKDWADALMTRCWELGGGEFWYSSTADRNVKFVRTGATFGSAPAIDYFEWVANNLHWQGLAFVFPNSTVNLNEIADQLVDSAGLTDLADGDCLYVDLDRSATHTRGGGTALIPQKVALVNLGSPVVPGSRQIIAYRYGAAVYTRDSYWAVGVQPTASTPIADTALTGTVKTFTHQADPKAPLVDGSGNVIARGMTRDAGGALSIGEGANDASINFSKTGADAVFKGRQLLHAWNGNSTTEYAPMEIWRDGAGNNGLKIDHNGYAVDRLSTHKEEWNYNTGNFASNLFYAATNSGGAGNVQIAAPNDNNIVCNFLALNSLSGGFGQAMSYITVRPTTNTVVVFETEVWMDEVNFTIAKCGLYDGFGAELAMFWFDPSVSVNWYALCVHSSVQTAVDTTIQPAITTATRQTLRIEIHGASTFIGAALGARVLFFINGTLRVTTTTHIPFNVNLRPTFYGGPETAASETVCFMPWTLVWNQHLTSLASP